MRGDSDNLNDERRHTSNLAPFATENVGDSSGEGDQSGSVCRT